MYFIDLKYLSMPTFIHRINSVVFCHSSYKILRIFNGDFTVEETDGKFFYVVAVWVINLVMIAMHSGYGSGNLSAI